MLDVFAAVSFCLAFFAGGYCLGRLAQPVRSRFGFDPDPLREQEDGVVVSIETARSRRTGGRVRERRAGAAAS